MKSSSENLKKKKKIQISEEFLYSYPFAWFSGLATACNFTNKDVFKKVWWNFSHHSFLKKTPPGDCFHHTSETTVTKSSYCAAIHISAKIKKIRWAPLSKKCRYSELFWSFFPRIQTEQCGEIHSMWMRESTDQKNDKYGHFSHSALTYITHELFS